MQNKRGVPKAPIARATKPGERLFLDISSPSNLSLNGNRHWLLVLDDATDLPFSFFLSHKDLLKIRLIPFIRQLKEEFGIEVRIIRCDNAGENIALERACLEQNLGIKFEYTAPGTPQQNGRVERKFYTLYSRVRAMLKDSGLDNIPFRNRLWDESGATGTNYDGILVRETGGECALNNFFGKGKVPLVDTIKKFGEICIVTDCAKIKAKLKDRGIPCHWLGYSPNHARGTYRLLNPRTRKIIQSREVKFLTGILLSCFWRALKREAYSVRSDMRRKKMSGNARAPVRTGTNK